MKTLLSVIAAVGLFALTGYPQVITNPPPTTTDVPHFLSDVWNFTIGEGITNLSVTGYGTYTPSIKKWGGGLVITRNIPIGNTGISSGLGIGLDYYDREFFGVTAQVNLSASLRPFSNWGKFGTNIVITPITYVGLGTPFGDDSGGTAGDLETIAAVGAHLHLVKVLGGGLGVGGAYGTRTGLGEASGPFWGAFLTQSWRF